MYIELAARGEDGVMAVIFARTGSAPRTAGARMLVRKGRVYFRHDWRWFARSACSAKAVDVFRTHINQVMEFSLTGADASQMEMICGGEVAVLIEFIDAANAGQQAFYQALAQSASNRHRSWLITQLPSDQQADPMSHALLTPGASPAAGRHLSGKPAVIGISICQLTN
jgi:xanthine dehydrogenase accessory factor